MSYRAIASFLTAELLGEAHTAAEYLEWVHSVIARLQGETDGLRRIRLRIGLAKELMSEALPIGWLVSTYFKGSKQVSIRLHIGSQNFDATVFDSRSEESSVQHIEVTLACDGEDDHLRMRVLHESGVVSGLGSVVKKGTQRTGMIVSVKPEMVSQAEILRRESDRVARAIKRKLGKPYPSNTLLLVGFDDTMAFDRSDNIANLEATVATHLQQLSAFHSIVIVGLQRGLCMSWRTAKESSF